MRSDDDELSSFRPSPISASVVDIVSFISSKSQLVSARPPPQLDIDIRLLFIVVVVVVVVVAVVVALFSVELSIFVLVLMSNVSSSC